MVRVKTISIKKVNYCDLENVRCIDCEEFIKGCQKYQEEKQCTKCGYFYPADTEFFPVNDCLTGKLHSWCKGCHNTQKKENYNKSKDRIRELTYNRVIKFREKQKRLKSEVTE